MLTMAPKEKKTKEQIAAAAAAGSRKNKKVREGKERRRGPRIANSYSSRLVSLPSSAMRMSLL